MAEWQAFIDELKSKCDIVDVVSSYMPLTQKGRNHWGLCPFHSEKTPSFSVSRTGQLFKCFGCGKSGDVITFIREYESLGFNEAVELLAKRVGLKPPKSIAAERNDEKAEKDKQKRDLHKAILLDAARFYRATLLSSKGAEAARYLHLRGLSDKTINVFGLGLSPDWDSVIDALREKGYSLNDIIEAGVVDKNEKGNIYDAMAKRIVIPIIDAMGNVIAFGGRTMDTNPSFAKYKNTGGTLLFNKSNAVFNANNLRKLRKEGKLNYIVLVEGYFDVIGLYEGGFKCATASMGTSLTNRQAAIMKRYTDDVYVCYDGDGAGRNAAVRGVDILWKEGLTVRVINLPDKEDPDDVIRKDGQEAFMRLISEAKALDDFKLSVIGKKFDLNAENAARREENRINYTREALEVISQKTDKVSREALIGKVAERTGFSEDFLRSSANAPPATVEFVVPKLSLTREEKQLSYIAACMLADRHYVDWDDRPNVTTDETATRVFDYIYKAHDSGEKPMADRIIGVAGEASNLVVAIMDVEFSGKPYEEEYYRDCIDGLRIAEVDKEIEQLKEEMRNAADDGQIRLMKEFQRLTSKRNAILHASANTNDG